MLWALTPDEFQSRLNNGFVRAGKATPNQPQAYIIQYLRSGSMKAIIDGNILISGRAADGSVVGHRVANASTMPQHTGIGQLITPKQVELDIEGIDAGSSVSIPQIVIRSRGYSSFLRWQ